jgi:hypothetical protein
MPRVSTTWEPVEDWEPVLRAGWFWQWYYCNSVLVDVDEDSLAVLAEIFGAEATGSDLRRLLGPGLDRLAPDLGSRLDLALPGGYTWRLRFHGGPGVDHIASGPGLAEPVCLGWDDPHPSHPALVWSEARALASHLTGVPDGFALPLLFPMASTRTDEDGNARRWLREAWTRTGVLDADRVAALVDALTVFPDDRGRPVPEDADPADSIASPPSTSRAPAVADAVAHLLAALD